MSPNPTGTGWFARRPKAPRMTRPTRSSCRDRVWSRELGASPESSTGDEARRRARAAGVWCVSGFSLLPTESGLAKGARGWAAQQKRQRGPVGGRDVRRTDCLDRNLAVSLCPRPDKPVQLTDRPWL